MNVSEIEIQRHTGAEAVASLEAPLRQAGILPGSVYYIHPRYLADGHEGNRPEAIVGTIQGEVVAYLPFVVRAAQIRIPLSRRSSISLPCRELRILGYEAIPGSGTEAARRAFMSLASEPLYYHRLVISEQTADGQFGSMLRAYAQERLLAPRFRCRLLDSYRVEIKGTMDEYIRSRFNSKARYNLRRTVRKLNDQSPSGSSCRKYEFPAQVPDFLRDAEQVARRSHQWSRGLPALRATKAASARLAFLASHGWWRGYILFNGEEPIAYCDGTVYARRFDYNIIGYDERYSRLSPGTVLLFSILEDLFSTGTADELDFGAGSDGYKRQFATCNAQVLYASAFSCSAYSFVLRCIQSIPQAIGKMMKMGPRGDAEGHSLECDLRLRGPESSSPIEKDVCSELAY